MPLLASGKTYLASAITGSYSPPLYLVLDSTSTTLIGTVGPGSTSFVLNARLDQAGDTQVTLSVGLGSAEAVTFTGVSGTGPYTYTCSGAAMAQTHTSGDICIRTPTSTDTMANILGEVEYDHTYAPGQRQQAPAGYSSGAGQWTASFYLTAIQSVFYIPLFGLSDSPTIGQGNLHAYFPLGFDHSLGTRDLEIDCTLTLT